MLSKQAVAIFVGIRKNPAHKNQDKNMTRLLFFHKTSAEVSANSQGVERSETPGSVARSHRAPAGALETIHFKSVPASLPGRVKPSTRDQGFRFAQHPGYFPAFLQNASQNTTIELLNHLYCLI